MKHGAAKRRGAAVLAVVCLAGQPWRADARGTPAGGQTAAVHTASIQLDPARTEIRFRAGSIRHVEGTFALKTGLFAVDTATGVAQGEILVDATSEHSNNAGVDRKIQGDTLEAAKYPGIVFHPEKVTGSLPMADGQSHLKLGGTLTVHGQDHSVELDLVAVRTGRELLLRTALTVPYVQWGMKPVGSLLIHDRSVQISVVSHGSLQAPQV